MLVLKINTDKRNSFVISFGNGGFLLIFGGITKDIGKISKEIL